MTLTKLLLLCRLQASLSFINMNFFFFFGCLACGILVSQPGIEPEPSAVKARHPNHWTTGEFPKVNIYRGPSVGHV